MILSLRSAALTLTIVVCVALPSFGQRLGNLRTRGMGRNDPEAKKLRKYLEEREVSGTSAGFDDRDPYGHIANQCLNREFLLDNAAMKRANHCIEQRTEEYDRRHPRSPTPAPPPSPTPTIDPAAEGTADGEIESGGEAVMDSSASAPGK